jgi:hypothetical protein
MTLPQKDVVILPSLRRVLAKHHYPTSSDRITIEVEEWLIHWQKFFLHATTENEKIIVNMIFNELLGSLKE